MTCPTTVLCFFYVQEPETYNPKGCVPLRGGSETWSGVRPTGVETSSVNPDVGTDTTRP